MRYDLNELSFLIGSFKDVINTFGKSSNSVDFYRRQVNGLISIGQISEESADLVNRIIGMQNTDSVKWDSAIESLDMYIYCIESTMNLKSDTEKKAMVAFLFNGGKISDKIRKLVNETYNISSLDITPTQNKGSFGTLVNNAGKDSGKKNIVVNTTAEAARVARKLEKVVNTFGYLNQELYLRIKNRDAVCSSDPSYFTFRLAEVINTLKDGSYIHSEAYRFLRKGFSYAVGYYFDNGDPCSRSRTFIEVAPGDKIGVHWKILA